MEPGRDDREEHCVHCNANAVHVAAMEPGRDDREEIFSSFITDLMNNTPLWSPVVTTGKSTATGMGQIDDYLPLWSPVVTTGKRGRGEAMMGRK